jgi:hypothetical protein
LPALSDVGHFDEENLGIIKVVVNTLQLRQSSLAPDVVRII